jgi:hypothetical protein
MNNFQVSDQTLTGLEFFVITLTILDYQLKNAKLKAARDEKLNKNVL